MIFVTGDINPTAIENCIDSGIKNNNPFNEEIKKIYPDEPKSVCKKKVEQSLSVSMPLFMIGFKDTDTGYSGDKLLEKFIEVSIINKMLFGKGTDFYKDLADSGLINDNFSFDYTAQPDYGHVTIEGESADAELVYDKIISYVNKMKKDGLSEADYERTKKVIWGDYIRSYNDVENFAHAFLNSYMMDTMYTNFENVYKMITFEKITERFNNLFDTEKTSISIINPL